MAVAAATDESAEQVDVAVVGAGLSGLACAAALESAGRSVVVLEARERVGGRLLSTADGVDLGGSWIWDQDTDVARLARRLGLAPVAQRLDGEAVAGSRRVGNVGGRVVPCGPDAARWQGGYARLPEAVAVGLKSVRLGCTVRAIGRGPTLHLNYERAGVAAVLEAKRAVVALPPRLVATLHFDPALPAEQIRLMRATPTWAGDWCKVVATFRTPFWRERGDSGVIVQQPGPISVWWEAGGGPEVGEASALAGLAVGAALDAEEVRPLVLAMLHAVYGPIGEEQLLRIEHKCWIEDPLTFAPGAAAVGDPRRVYGHPLLQRAAEGVHFAGTETEAEAGHCEGALKAGERAAREVLVALREI